MTKFEHLYMLRALAKKYSKDETIVFYNRLLSELQIENGVLKSEVARLEHEYEALKNTKNPDTHNTLKKLRAENHEFRWQLECHGLLPKHLTDPINTKNKKHGSRK